MYEQALTPNSLSTVLTRQSRP